jgi:hypothetical protein
MQANQLSKLANYGGLKLRDLAVICGVFVAYSPSGQPPVLLLPSARPLMTTKLDDCL